MAIPVELTQQERLKLATQFCKWLAQKYQVAVDCCMHRKDKNDPQENPHIHVMFTTRCYSQDGTLGAKTRELDDLKTRKTHLLHIRERWANFCNEYLQFYGEIIDHRSFKDQGIDALPQIHVGSTATTMACRGLETERGALNRDIQNANSEILQLQQEIENVRYLENGSGKDCSTRVREYETDDSELSEEISTGGGQQRLGPGLSIDGYGAQGIAGGKSSNSKNGQGGNTAISFYTDTAGTSGSSGARPCPVEDGCQASATHKNRTERVATLEALAHSCVSTFKEIHYDIYALVEAANLRCLENSIRQHSFQRLKGRGIESMVECGRIIKEILHAVDRVNEQAIHQALLFSAPQPSSRLVTIDEKTKKIIAVSQDIQKEILAAVDHRNFQYIQEYLDRRRLTQLKASCLEIRVECDSTIREIFEATDRLDAQFIEQWLARHSQSQILVGKESVSPVLSHSPGILRINLDAPEPPQWAESNGMIRINLDDPPPSELNPVEGASDNPDDAATDYAPK